MFFSQDNGNEPPLPEWYIQAKQRQEEVPEHKKLYHFSWLVCSCLLLLFCSQVNYLYESQKSIRKTSY